MTSQDHGRRVSRRVGAASITHRKYHMNMVMKMKIPHILFQLVTAVLLIASQLSNAYAPLAGITARSLKLLEDVDLSEFVSTPAAKGEKSMLVLGTYAADFNAIEYAQRYVDNPSLPFTGSSSQHTTYSISLRLRYYMPQLHKRGITKIGLVLNCESDVAKKLADLVDLPCDAIDGKGITLMVDPTGRAGKAFGVGTGWRPHDTEMSPYIKLFGMLWGLGVSDQKAFAIHVFYFLLIQYIYTSGMGYSSCCYRWIHWKSIQAPAVD